MSRREMREARVRVAAAAAFILAAALAMSSYLLRQFSAGTTIAILVASLAALMWLYVQRRYFVGDTSAYDSPALRLAQELGSTLEISYLQTWLTATLLNPGSLSAYWHRDNNLRIEEAECRTWIQGLDARLQLTFKGRNESATPARSCPMLMFGGSVLHYRDLRENRAVLVDGRATRTMECRSKLDTGQLHLVEMIFPTPLLPGNDFEVRQTHLWPVGMAEGEDTLWFPYSMLFNRPSRKLTIRVSFDRPLKHLKAIEARVHDNTFKTALRQPQDATGDAVDFEWEIDPVDNAILYGLVFERA